MDFAPVQLQDIAKESVSVPRKQAALIEEDIKKVIEKESVSVRRKQAGLIKEDIKKVIAMANESVTNQDIKSAKELVTALVIVSDIEKGRKLRSL